jgi:hypothetical protein
MSIKHPKTAKDNACLNTDRELFRLGDYYSPRVFVTDEGGIGIDVGGEAFVMEIVEWHKLAKDKYGDFKKDLR